jgi:hypothetical protein
MIAIVQPFLVSVLNVQFCLYTSLYLTAVLSERFGESI